MKSIRQPSTDQMLPALERLAGRNRVVIEDVTPQVDCGRFAAKRIVGDVVEVRAAAFTDGHDLVRALLLWRRAGETAWQEAPMKSVGQDLWQGEFVAAEMGRYEYTVAAWVDHWHTWVHELEKRHAAGQDLAVDLAIGSEQVRAAADQAEGYDRERLLALASILSSGQQGDGVGVAFSEELERLMHAHALRHHVTRYDRELTLIVDRERAGFSAWYEVFPRSTSPEPGKHGTLRDVVEWLPYIAGMGFDVLYLPPIHPIGHNHRKGKNNAERAEEGDVGSPWGIGAREGGHKAIHPELGTLDDFRFLLERAADHGLELALDIAFQTSPDHPYVTEHPAWFRHRPDGTIQYAENPPKKYQDIYPFDFETEDWPGLWVELKSVFDFWIGEGVRIFRVDNPHTKAFPFWEWAITEIKREHPDVLFLSEAFTRPRVMQRLAKLGFSQSYTYFTWRNTKWELGEYIKQLTQTDVKEYLRPNFWPNTPDILNEYLQVGGRPAFMTRVALAATLVGNFGIYGPAFELVETRPRSPGSEEYLDSEKYQIRAWDRESPHSLRWLITRLNQIRRENPALQRDGGVELLPIDNDHLFAFARYSADGANAIVVVANLDPFNTHTGWLELPLEALGVSAQRSYQVHDLLTDARYLWNGPRNFVKLDPETPAHVFRVRRWVRTEHDFEYFL